jgi:hypothetical protein
MEAVRVHESGILETVPRAVGVVDTVLPLAEAWSALEQPESGRHYGKIVPAVQP